VWLLDEVDPALVVGDAVAAAGKSLRCRAVLTLGLRTDAQTGGGRDHRRSSGVDGVDDLRTVVAWR